MEINTNKPKESISARIFRALIETGFIIFLFYSNLLMGEYDRTGNGQKKSLWWTLNDIFTLSNFEIALAAAIVGYIVFEYLRKKI
jgi:hypothetical protein